jgi:ABC-type nitrate/sulfonate/bicarbonate transport system permease component
VEGINIIESSLGTKHSDPLGSLLFALAHYQTLLNTIVWVPSYVFPSLTNDTHIVGPLSEIIHVFYHLSTQLTQVGLKVKVSKCKPWNPSGISTCIEIPRGYTLVIDGLCILGVLMGSQDFATHFLDEVLQYLLFLPSCFFW